MADKRSIVSNSDFMTALIDFTRDSGQTEDAHATVWHRETRPVECGRTNHLKFFSVIRKPLFLPLLDNL